MNEQNIPQVAQSAQETRQRRQRGNFRKTQLCRFQAANRCIKGQECDWAHGEAELRNLPDFTKTSVCRSWMRGECPLTSEDCPFAHGKEELCIRTARLEKCPTRPTLQGEAELRNLPDLTKTSVCRKWMRKECPLTSEECPFVHAARLKKCLTEPALQGLTPLPQWQQDAQGPEGNSDSIPDGVTEESKIMPWQMTEKLIGVVRGPEPNTLPTQASIPFIPVVMIDPGFLHKLLVESMPDHYED